MAVRDAVIFFITRCPVACRMTLSMLQLSYDIIYAAVKILVVVLVMSVVVAVLMIIFSPPKKSSYS